MEEVKKKKSLEFFRKLLFVYSSCRDFGKWSVFCGMFIQEKENQFVPWKTTNNKTLLKNTNRTGGGWLFQEVLLWWRNILISLESIIINCPLVSQREELHSLSHSSPISYSPHTTHRAHSRWPIRGGLLMRGECGAEATFTFINKNAPMQLVLLEFFRHT